MSNPTLKERAGMVIAACSIVGIKNGKDFNDVIKYIYAHQDEFFTLPTNQSSED